jgi:hypothetical protein
MSRTSQPERDPIERAAAAVRAADSEPFAPRRGPVLDADLEDTIRNVGAGANPSGEQVAALREKLGSWRPGLAEKPAHGRARSAKSARLRGVLVQCGEQLRASLTEAGQARAEALAAAGFDPAAAVLPTGGETTPRGQAAAWDTRAFAASLEHSSSQGQGSTRLPPVPIWPPRRAGMPGLVRRRTIDIREMGVAYELGIPARPEQAPGGPVPGEAQAWEGALLGVQAGWAAMNLIALRYLPRPRRLAARTAQIWYGLALDRFYYAEPDPFGDLAGMEECAWTLLRGLPQGRAPRGGPRLLVAGHESWTRWWLAEHDAELHHLAAIGEEVKTIQREAKWRDPAGPVNSR